MKSRTANRLLLMLLFVLIPAATVFAQGVQTATLQGTVSGQDGTPLPGVTVTVKSPALMGERTAITQGGGDYNLRGLPPGDYTITMSLEGMQPTTVKRNLALGQTTIIDAKMKVASVAEAITVTAAAPTVIESQTVGANIKDQTVQQLPLLRDPVNIGSIAPGVTGDRGGRATTPVAGQLSINGGIAFDNNFLINGVNFQDNIFGNTNNLFVEDAIQETQVLTSGISAEYGHFTGGVLNVITKSGGNTFTGSFRDDMNKPSWLALTPYEKGFRGVGVANAAAAPHTGKLSNIYEVTLGGPILKDRLWFFLAGRDEKSNTPSFVPATGEAFTIQQQNRRPEYKLTASIGSGHTLQGDYINNPVSRNFEVQVTPLDMHAVGVNSTRENSGYSGYYSGVLTSALFAEARYSKKHFGFRGLGGTSRNILDSPFRPDTTLVTGNLAGTFNAPYFDATDPEDRNNKQAFGSLSYFVSTKSYGSHDLKGGYEKFTDERTGGNSQTATDYVFFTGYKMNGAVPVIDANGYMIPVFVPHLSNSDVDWTAMNYYQATRGAKLDVTTDSLFINDRWNLNSHLSFNIGARYEKAKSKVTGSVATGIDTSNLAPRLGASYDIFGTGKYKVDVTYAGYVGRYNPSLTGANSVVGNPSRVTGYYVGPAGEGRNFAPGFDPNNYHFYTASVPTANIFTDPNMHAPINNEITLSFGTAFARNGWFKVTGVDRKYKEFIQAFINIQNGCTNVSLKGVNVGCVDNVRYTNTDGPKRHYQAAEFQAHYEILRNWAVEGNWTHQLQNNGNYEAESGQSIITSAFGQRPEMQSPRELPVGHLAQYEANRVRLFTTYTFSFGRFGNLSSGFLYRYDSPQTFSYTASVARSAQSKGLNPGYNNAPGTITLFFGDRGAGTYRSSSLFDSSLQYSIPITRLTPWVKFDVRNVFNKDTQTAWTTSIAADSTSPKDPLGYATGFTKSAAFGRPRGALDFVRPREYLLYAGVRF